MGLRTTSRTPSLSTKETITNCELPSTSLSITEVLKSTIFLHPDAAISGKMAPALTEPLSPTNKLSSSAASASPRPTAAGSPLQTNNNNNNNNTIIHTHNNNNNDSSIGGSVDENSSIQTNLITNNSGSGDKEKIVEGKSASVAATPTSTPTSTPASAKGAFQLAFEQSVGVRKTPTPTVVNGGDALSANSSQMGPMCDSKSSQPPPLAANSSPLIKSKFIPIDPEAAAKIITTGFEDFPSDIEEAITAEICLRQKLKFTEEQAQIAAKQNQDEKEQSSLKVGLDSLEEQQQDVQSDLKLGEELLDAPKKSMDEACDETAVKPVDETQGGKTPSEEVDVAATKEPNAEKRDKDINDSSCKPNKINIISVQELPPIKTDSTVTASEEDDNIEERLKQLDSTDDCPMPISQESGDIPTTPTNTLSAQVMSQLTPTNTTNIPTTSSISSLTPLSTSSTLCGSSGNPKEFKDNNSEMDHEINDEDLLQVLKGFDTNAGSDICDLAGFLSEYGMNYEDVNPPTAKENPIKEVQIEIEKNQQTMQRKVDFLSRRLRKLQARYMSKQASEEISGLFEWSARTTKRKNSNADHQQLTYAEEKYNPVTTTTMRSVLKKIENVATSVQKLSPLKKISKTIERPPSPVNIVVVPTYDEKITEEIAHVSGRLQAEMREVQSAIDSDATASSSGGESADEMVPYNNITQDTLPISKRAAWRYSRDRAGIASRWSWLLSQIADLEFKIRQHTELHQQLRQRKGKVVMLEGLEAGNLTAAIGGVNGYRGSLPGETTSKGSGGGFTTADETDVETTIDASHESSSQGACRTRAFQSSFYRKRKLFQTANVHTISKKAARPSTIKCGCQWPLHPCALCTGRSDPTAPRDLPDTMMKSQRVALLDPGFHPVLSFAEDISSSILFESISKDPDWQNRVVKSTAKAVIKGALAAQRAAEKEEQRGAHHATSGRITPSTPHNANASSSSNVGATTGKRKYTKKNHQDSHSGGSQSTTPLVANNVGKSSKKHHRQRNQSPDYVAYPRKASKTNSNHQTLSSHQSLHRNAEQSNHHPAHSSLIYQHSKNNKIRKLSSASTAAATAATTPILNNLNIGSHLFNNNIINSNFQQLNNQQHHSYNNELNFLHCDSLDGDSSTNGLMIGPAGRSRTSSPTHGSSAHYKHERSLERRSRTSYDIDNIVIPYSVAAATRVELLPYKEIPTPKWRTIDYDAVNNNKTESDLEGENKSERTEENKQLESINPSKAEEQTSKPSNINKEKANNSSSPSPCNSDEEDEDISDEAMILRHERALTEERRKFQTFLKFPYSTRSRANRRIDSRAESSGANTPDPTSPAPNTPSVGGDQESIPSPFAPSTPMTPLESIAETGETSSNPSALENTPSIMSLLNSISKKQERRRTVSAKKEKDEQRRSSTPDPREQIPPFEPLTFPIPDEIFDSMLKMMPDEYPLPQEDCPQSTTPATTTTTTGNGLVDTNISLPPGVAQKIVCDQKLNNNKNAFLTLNNQKTTEHITGENEEEEENEDEDYNHYYLGAVNGDTIKEQMQSPQSLALGMEFQPSFMCRNNLIGCSDTESLETENDGDDDPNDPEWKEEEKRK